MKSKIIIGYLWVLLCPAFAQNDINIWYKDCTNCAYADKDSGKNYNYSASKKFKIEDINHNFDRRNPPGGTLWHRGWDINLAGREDQGDIIVSNVAGTSEILDINVALDAEDKSDLVVVTVSAGNNSAYCYLHGWRNKEDPKDGIRSGDLVLLDPDKDENYCILDTKSKKAWCEVNYNGMGFSFDGYQYGSQPGDISFTRQYGDPIYPVGTSGVGADNYHTHVEVIQAANLSGDYWNGLNARCPAVLLDIKQDQKGLGKAVQKSQNIDVYDASGQPGVSIRYPGNKSTSIKARIKIDGVANANAPYNKVAMVDQVQYLVTPKSEPLINKLITGKSLQGEICIGSNKTRYPESIKDNIGAHYAGSNDGVTGMESFAYNNSTGAHPWDDYYFSDFAPRKYKNFQSQDVADFSVDAQYPDGEYNLAVCAFEAGDSKNYHCSEVYPFAIDNFLPFISSVKVNSYLNGLPATTQIYERELVSEEQYIDVANDGKIITGTKHTNSDFEGLNTYRVEAVTSEPMKKLECGFKNFLNFKVEGKPDVSRMKWIFDFPPKNLSEGEYVLKFTGQDVSGNDLLKMHELANYKFDDAVIPFPSRKSLTGSISDKWNNANSVKLGSDEFHVLTIKKDCGKYFSAGNELRGADCFAAAFDFKVLPDGNSVEFTNKSEGNPTSYSWQFGDGAVSSEENPTHEYNKPGKYKVKLTAELNGETDAAQHIVDIKMTGPDGNLELSIDGNAIVALGAHQTYTSQVTGGYPPYAYSWSTDGDFILGTCPGYYSWAYDKQFEAEFNAPGCSTGSSGNIKLTVTDSYNHTATATLPVTVAGEAPGCKIVWSGKAEIDSEIDFKIVNKNFFQGIDCKDYYAYFDWYVEGLNNGYYDASNKNILWWLPGYKFPDKGSYKVTAKGKKGLYEPYTGEFFTTIVIGADIPPSPPAPPFEFFPAGTLDVKLGEQLTADPNNPNSNFYMALNYKNPLDQDDHNCGNNKTFDATGYQFNLKITSPGTGATKSYTSGMDLQNDQVGNKYPLRGNPNAPVDITIGPDNYGCNDVTVEVYPIGYTCAQYDQLDGFCSTTGVSKLCTTYPSNAYIWSECFTCPANGDNGKFKNYKYDLPVIIEKKCAFMFDPPPLVIKPAIVKTEDCGKTYLEADVEGGAAFTSGNNTPNGFPCSGTLQPYKKYEWSSFTMDDTPVETDVIKKGNSKCVEINYDSKYFDKYWHEAEVSFKVVLKVWDRLDDYAVKDFYVTVIKPMRWEIPADRTVCAGSSMVFNNGFPLLSGGSGDFTYQWSSTQYFSTGFDAGSPDPQLDLPENENGSAVYNLLVTDNISGCTLANSLTIHFGSITVNAGPDIITCIGESLKNLGLAENEVMVSGGDGNYTYSWDSSVGFENLSDPQSLRPTVKAIDNIPVSYYLEVRDGSGCYARDEVIVTGGHTLNFLADAGPDKTICYGVAGNLTGNNINDGNYLWTVEPKLPISQNESPGLDLGKDFTTRPGNYTFTYQVSDNIGCYATDQVMLTVADQWKYEGFEPGISYIVPDSPLTPGGMLFDKVKPKLTQLPKIYTVTDNKGSGAVSPFTYTWTEPGVEAKIPQNSKVVSQDGYLQEAYILEPQESGYSMGVTDALGCSMDFHSNYFLLHSGQKSLEVTSVNGEYYLCNEAKLQFKVVYNTGYTGTLPTKLPQKLNVEFDVQDWIKTTNTGDFGQFYKQGEKSGVLLTLTNTVKGIYEGIITLKKNDYFFVENYSDCGLQATHFYKMYVTSNQPNYNVGVVKFNIYKSGNVPIINCCPTTTITGPCIIPRRIWAQKLVAIGSWTSCGSGDLKVINGGQCDVRVGYADVNLEGILLKNYVEVEEGSYFHAYIDPLCIGQSFKPVKDPVIIDESDPISNDVLQVQYQYNDGLLFPNPANGLINIKRRNGEAGSILINSICVYNIMGQQMTKKSITQDWSFPVEFDVSNLNPGAYFIELKSIAGEVYRFNFIKINN